MSFDKAEHTAGLLYEINFFIVYGKMLFLFLCKIAIRAHDAAVNSSRDKPFDLSQEVELMSCNLILKNSIMHPIIYWYLGNYSIFIS